MGVGIILAQHLNPVDDVAARRPTMADQPTAHHRPRAPDAGQAMHVNRFIRLEGRINGIQDGDHFHRGRDVHVANGIAAADHIVGRSWGQRLNERLVRAKGVSGVVAFIRLHQIDDPANAAIQQAAYFMPCRPF